MSNDMYLPALPLISRDFSVPLNWIQFTIAAWLAGDACVQLVVGPLSDRFGRRPILLWGGALFLTATIACALAPSVTFLIVARFFQGVGVCSMMVAGYASVHDLYDDQKAIHLLAWMGSAAVLAPAVGPLFGGLLLLIADWRMIFYLLFFLSLFALLGLWICMPESIPSNTKRSVRTKNLIEVYRSIFSTPAFIISALSFGLLYGGMIAWITDSPFLLIQTLEISPTEFGWIQLFIFGSYIIGARVIKLFIQKISAETIIFSGLCLSLIATTALMLFSLLMPSDLRSYILPMIGYSIGFGMASAPLNRVTINAITAQRGAAISVFYLTMTACGTLISFLLSIFPDSVLLLCSFITGSILLSFILNKIRQSCYG